MFLFLFCCPFLQCTSLKIGWLKCRDINDAPNSKLFFKGNFSLFCHYFIICELCKISKKADPTKGGKTANFTTSGLNCHFIQQEDILRYNKVDIPAASDV